MGEAIADDVTDARSLLVDARAPFGSGLGRYLREIVRALAAREDFREIVLAGDPAALAPFLETLEHPLRVIALPHGRYAWQVPVEWGAIAAAVGGPHVTWFPHWDGAWSAQPCATTLHDLIALEGSGPKAVARRTVARSWMGRMIRASGVLLTGSEGSAARIRETFPEAGGKLRVVPHGVTSVFFEAAPRARDLPGVPADAPYLLTVANKKPHKRLETAVAAFAELAREDATLQLVMVGERFAHAGTLRVLATRLGVAERVHDVAGLPDATLAGLYAGAEALLVCSREEGFGMVALEAMAAGAPVVAGDRAPLPEVVGDAGVLVPFDDAAAMAAAVRRLRADAAWRAELVRRGRAHAAGYTWARAAAGTAAVLRTLV